MEKNREKSNTQPAIPDAAAGLGDRLSGLLILAAFTVLIALISMIFVNAVIFPVTVFAVSHKEGFTSVIHALLRFGTIAALLAAVTFRVFRLKKLGFGAGGIASYMAARFLYYTAVSAVFLILTVLIIAVLYFAFSGNYYILYKMISG